MFLKELLIQGLIIMMNKDFARGGSMSKVKFVAMGMAVLMIFNLLVGCSSSKYNAELYDTATDWINEEFASGNIVRRLGDSEDKDPHPKTLTFIVENQEVYDKIFNDNADQLDIDFDTQMLVVYTFSTVYHRDNKITSMDIDNGVLTIIYKMDSNRSVIGFNRADASLPYQRWFVVKLDKQEINSVVFTESK